MSFEIYHVYSFTLPQNVSNAVYAPLIGSASREGTGRGEKREARVSKGEQEEKRGTTHVACLRTNGNLGLPFPSGMCGGSSNERTKCTMPVIQRQPLREKVEPAKSQTCEELKNRKKQSLQMMPRGIGLIREEGHGE